ncbi:MAG: hypothetical protein WB791_02665 [Waddliaceae bacterium]
MERKKYFFQNSTIRLEIREDSVGWYLFAYRPPFEKPFCDYLQDTKEDIFEDAKKMFGVESSQWKELK